MSQVAKGQTPGQQRATGLHHSWPKHDVSLYLWPNKSDVITEQMAEIIFGHREESSFPLPLQRKSLQACSGFALSSRPLDDQVYTPRIQKGGRFPAVHGRVPSPFQTHRFPKQPYSPESLRKEENVAQKVRNQVALNSARH